MMVFPSVKLKGALTNKPFAFSGRAWEFYTHKTINFFDVFCEDILIELRGLIIARILPLFKDIDGLTWITDKIRFFFDSIKYQRNHNISLCFHDVKTVVLEWNFILSFYVFYLLSIKLDRFFFFFKFFGLANNYFKSNYDQILLFNLNFNSDILDTFSFSSIIKKIGGGFYSNQEFFSNIFVYNSTNRLFLGKKKDFFNFLFDTILLVGLDIRFEFPKLFLLLKRQIKKIRTSVFIFGARNLGLNFLRGNGLKFISPAISDFFKLLNGTHYLNNILMKISGNRFKKCCFVSRTIVYDFLRVNKLLFKNYLYFLEKYSFKSLVLDQNLGILNFDFLNFRSILSRFKLYKHFDLIKNKSGLIFDNTNAPNLCFLTHFLHCNLNPFINFFQKKNLGCFINLPSSFFFERKALTFDIFGKLKDANLIVKNFYPNSKSSEQKPCFEIFQVIEMLFSYNLKFSESILFKFVNLKVSITTFFKSTVRSKVREIVKFLSICKTFFDNRFTINFYNSEEFSRNSVVLSVLARKFGSLLLNYI